MLKDKELKEIQGGGISVGAGLFIGGVIAFLIGVIDGYVRPLACR